MKTSIKGFFRSIVDSVVNRFKAIFKINKVEQVTEASAKPLPFTPKWPSYIRLSRRERNYKMKRNHRNKIAKISRKINYGIVERSRHV